MQQERNRGGENLVFANAQEAAQFREAIETRVATERLSGVTHRREAVAHELAKKFEEHGIGVSSLHTPWEHSKEEHSEVQDLVNIAFADSISVALRRAEHSSSFPRNIDLFHDVLTGELYDAVLGRRLNAVHISKWMMVVLILPVLLLIAAILFFVYSL